MNPAPDDLQLQAMKARRDRIRELVEIMQVSPDAAVYARAILERYDVTPKGTP